MNKILYIGESHYSSSDRKEKMDQIIPFKSFSFIKRNLLIKPLVKLERHESIFYFFSNDMKNMKSYDAIIVNENSHVENLDISILKYLRKNFPEKRVIYWFRNTYAIPKLIQKVNRVKEFTNEIYTFDKLQAEKANIGYNTQNLPTKILDNHYSKLPKIDVSLIASLKDRGPIYLEIINKIKEYNLTSNIVIVLKRTQNLPKDLKDLRPFITRKYLDKIQYDKIQAESRILVDIYQKGQEGETLRPLEALILKKKIITNNTRLKDMPFYNPENYFFIYEDDWEQLPYFVNKPYNDKNQSKINYYSIDNWLRRFNLYVE